MDLKTLLAGYRALSESEADQKLSVIAKAYDAVKLRNADLDFDAYLGGLPVDLVANHFGSDGFDAYYTYNSCVTNGLGVDDDVYYSSVVHNIVMMLTYQARFIGRRPAAECAVVVGGTPAQFCRTFLNANVVTGVGFVEREAYEDNARRCIEAFEGNANVLKNIVLTDYENFPNFISSTPCEVGLIALGDGARIAEFNTVLAQSIPFLSDSAFVCFTGSLDWIMSQVRVISDRFPSLDVEVRPYLCNTSAGPRERAVVVISGLREPFALEAEGANNIPVRFVNVHAQADSGNQNFRVASYGKGFTNRGHLETVEIKRPVVIKSTSPLPPYTRHAIEGPIDISHYAAFVRGGGIRYSADPVHSTYVYVTNRGEVIEDFNEPGQYLKTEVFKRAQGEGLSRTSEFEVGHRQNYKGQLIPLCFSPGVHNFHSHFLLQCFPRVLVAREICPDARFAVPWDLKRYQREMLELVGVTADRLVPIYPDGTVYCDELIVPHLWPAIFSRYSEQIYREMIDRVGPNPSRPSRRILISREARTTWRNMVNYNVVKDILTEEFNFEVVSPDKFKLVDEINLFKESAVIAGAEGAGLYNCCFATEKSAVLNMADQDYVMYIVGSMAQIRGFELGYVFGESFQADEDLTRRAGHTDFVIDPRALRSATRQLIDRLGDRWGH